MRKLIAAGERKGTKDKPQQVELKLLDGYNKISYKDGAKHEKVNA